jgi:hypothetical protein
MSAPSPAVSDVIRVNLDDEVKKMAVADGVTDSAELLKVVGVKRYDQYAGQIRSYYAGYDRGYLDGLNAVPGGRMKRIWERLFNIALVVLVVALVIALVKSGLPS